MGETMKLYKVLTNNESHNGGSHKWVPGIWYKEDGELEICKKGFHLTTKPMRWVRGLHSEIWEAETLDDIDNKMFYDDKVVVSTARITKKAKMPKWYPKLVSFGNSIKNISFLKPDGKPLKEWRLFTGRTWEEAHRKAARDFLPKCGLDIPLPTIFDTRTNINCCSISRSVLEETVHDKTRKMKTSIERRLLYDAIRYGAMIICPFWLISYSRRKMIKKCWNVWVKGYGLYNVSSDGVYYVYMKKR
jgi:hypothetical protein